MQDRPLEQQEKQYVVDVLEKKDSHDFEIESKQGKRYRIDGNYSQSKSESDSICCNTISCCASFCPHHHHYGYSHSSCLDACPSGGSGSSCKGDDCGAMLVVGAIAVTGLGCIGYSCYQANKEREKTDSYWPYLRTGIAITVGAVAGWFIGQALGNCYYESTNTTNPGNGIYGWDAAGSILFAGLSSLVPQCVSRVMGCDDNSDPQNNSSHSNSRLFRAQRAKRPLSPQSELAPARSTRFTP